MMDFFSLPIFYYVDPVYRAMVWAFVAMLGAALGSFSSAIAYRTLRGRSWVIGDAECQGGRAARSTCPNCGHVLGVADLIPIFSWVFLGGKCRYCRLNVPMRYPILEAVSAALFLGFFVGKGDQIPLIYTGIFALVLPFFMAFIGALLEKKRGLPKILYLYGLFSAMIMISIIMFP